MNTIFIITIIFIVIYNTWYDSYISQLFLLASKDTEKNSQRWKTIWSERDDLIWWKLVVRRFGCMGVSQQPAVKGLKLLSYYSYISQLFLLASKDTEKNSQRWKTIWSERDDLIWWKLVVRRFGCMGVSQQPAVKGLKLLPSAVKSIYFYRQSSKTKTNTNR